MTSAKEFNSYEFYDLILFQKKEQREIVYCLLNGVNKGQKYPEIVREFILNLRYFSPRAYDFMRCSFNKNLPDNSTIRAWYANSDINCTPGVHDSSIQILKKKCEARKQDGKELVVSLSFDEMHLSTLVQFDSGSKTMVGYETYNYADSESRKEANQMIAFLVRGMDENFQLLVAYHFIVSLDAASKKTLLMEVVDKITETGTIISNITFDGFPANKTMCTTELGANFDIYSSMFKPYFTANNGRRIYIIFDPSHMHKLVRNKLGEYKFFNELNEKILWKYIEELVRYSNEKNFSGTHKLGRKHIEWQNNKMKVNIACQTLSDSVAQSIQFLMDSNYPEFQHAGATIEFIKLFNDLFDIVNTKFSQNPKKYSNVYRKPISHENKNEIFHFFDKATDYIKKLKFAEETGEIKYILKSQIKTGFMGYIVTMQSLKLMYNQFVEEEKILQSIATYYISQDFIEMTFGKLRSPNFCGYNDNPTCFQVYGNYRKVLLHDIVCVSKRGNCIQYDAVSRPYSNIFTISSKKNKNDNDDFEDPLEQEYELLFEKLSRIEQMEQSSLTDDLKDFSIAHVANIIEEKIKTTDEMFCPLCPKIFDENEKIQKSFTSSNYKSKPCVSTFIICKEADKFLKLQLLNDHAIEFNTVYFAIFENINSDTLYCKTDFSKHTNEDHKLHLIRSVVDSYIKIKATHIARKTSADAKGELIRNKLRKIVHVNRL